jgi:hypothetical protein
MLAKGRRDKHDYCGSWRFKGSVFPDQALIFVAENSMNAYIKLIFSRLFLWLFFERISLSPKEKKEFTKRQTGCCQGGRPTKQAMLSPITFCVMGLFLPQQKCIYRTYRCFSVTA